MYVYINLGFEVHGDVDNEDVAAVVACMSMKSCKLEQL